MKKTITAAVLALIVSLGFTKMNPTQKTVNVKESSITWTGKKVLGKHNGTINLKSGELEMDGDKLVGGSFIVDMTSIVVTDLEGDDKEKLEEHFNSVEFFDTTNYPEASFIITNTEKSDNGYNVVGDLTIKGHTESIEVNMTVTTNMATTTFEVDRTLYDVRYGSESFFDNLKNNAISDDFELVINLKF